MYDKNKKRRSREWWDRKLEATSSMKHRVERASELKGMTVLKYERTRDL
jgi:hypothetical protein